MNSIYYPFDTNGEFEEGWINWKTIYNASWSQNNKKSWFIPNHKDPEELPLQN